MDDSPLGRLPRELRDKIYEDAVVHRHGITIVQNTSMNAKTASKVARGQRNKNTTLALAKTCRQAHNETIKLYYSLNTFYFPFKWPGVELLKNFIRKLKNEHYESLRHVVFRAPNRSISWRERRPRRLTHQWYEVIQHIVENAAELLPGPIYVGGSFLFACNPSKLHPKGKFDFVIDMNRKKQSMGENWQAAVALNQYLSYGTKGTALVYLLDQTAALMGQFGPDQQESGAQSHEEDGDTPLTASNDLSGQPVADSEESGEQSHEADGGADEIEDKDGGQFKVWELEDDDDDDLEDGKMVAATSFGDQYFARASGPRS